MTGVKQEQELVPAKQEDDIPLQSLEMDEDTTLQLALQTSLLEELVMWPQFVTPSVTPTHQSVLV
jgi:hypothetical protein